MINLFDRKYHGIYVITFILLLWTIAAIFSLDSSEEVIPIPGACGVPTIYSRYSHKRYTIHLIPHSHDDVGW